MTNYTAAEVVELLEIVADQIRTARHHAEGKASDKAGSAVSRNYYSGMESGLLTAATRVNDQINALRAQITADGYRAAGLASGNTAADVAAANPGELVITPAGMTKIAEHVARRQATRELPEIVGTATVEKIPVTAVVAGDHISLTGKAADVVTVRSIRDGMKTAVGFTFQHKGDNGRRAYASYVRSMNVYRHTSTGR